MVLVSGRPISFKMDLYQPLFIPRPTVEPELFASLRPPTFSGAMTNPGQPGAPPPPAVGGFQGGGFQGMNPNWGNAGNSINRYNGVQLGQMGGQSLMQGPITVYEGSTYAGDARVMDLQPNEERLVAYAVDQGTEVKCEHQSAPVQLVSVKVFKGIVHATNKLRDTKKYVVKNR